MNNLPLNYSDMYIGIVLTATSIVLARGIMNLYKIIDNISWLKKTHYSSDDYKIVKDFPPIIICIPMLREQRTAKSTIEYFSSLEYAKKDYQLVIVTTEKERYDKDVYKKRLPQIYADLKQGISLASFVDRYLGVFSEAELVHLFQAKDKGISLKEITEKFNQIPSTEDIAQEEAKRINKKVGFELIKVLHYPKNHRTVSEQINYAIDYYRDIKRYERGYFALYNADSRPSLTILYDALVTKANFERKYNYSPQVMQQSSLFTLNYGMFKNNLNGFLLKASALFQTKWTLTHEFSILRSQSDTAMKIKKVTNPLAKIWYSRLGICITHGLFLSMKLIKTQYMPTDTVTEDLPLGYYLSCLNEPIVPIPSIENSESPVTLGSLFNQKKVWFWPYLQYEQCKRRVLKHSLYQSTISVYLITFQGQLRGLTWLLQSPILILSFLGLVMFNHWQVIEFSLLAIIIYWFIPIYIVLKQLNSLENESGKGLTTLSSRDYIYTPLSGLLVLASHSYGPILTCIDYLKEILFGKVYVKQKTER